MKRVVLWAVLVLFVAAVVEGMAALAVAVLAHRGELVAVPRLSDAEIARALARRSAHLGWGPATDAAGRVAVPVPRPDPAFADEPPCVSAYGDSFTLGAADDVSYPHALALRLGCRVANFGVGGYGSDQAVMLFRAQMDADPAPVVLLGHMTEDIERNVNQYRLFLDRENRLGFKPRFVLAHGGLAYVPIPVARANDYRALAATPEAWLPAESFLARRLPVFPYSVALARWAVADLPARVRTKLWGMPPWAPLYAADHPSDALAVTTRLLSVFAAEAIGRGKTPVVVILPARADLRYAQRSGTWVDQPLVDGLRAEGRLVLHPGEAMLARLAGADPGRIFTESDGHPTAEGYAMLGDAIADGLAAAQVRPGVALARGSR
jgi:hypothetical protein